MARGGMVKGRLDSLKRIERVQRQLRDLAAWRLATAVKGHAALARDRREMIDAIERDLASGGPLAAATTRALWGVEERIEISSRDRQARSDSALVAASRASLSDRALIGAESRDRDERERRGLAEIVERSIGPLKARLG